MTLSDLQRLALTNSPTLRQAAAEVEAARGAAVQAGLYPNPNVGYEGDTMNQGATAGMQGAYIEQTIKTAGKLKLAQAAALMDLHNAELAFRRTQVDVMTQVRQNYFAVLVALETLKVTRALSRFTEEVYRIQIDQVKGEQAAPYEPLQLRVLAVQARGALVQARNRYTAAWKQLTAALGLPGMPPTELGGRVDVHLPLYRYEEVLARVLSQHTDVLAAQNTLHKARYDLRLAQVTPIPDVDVRVMVQKDFTTPPFLGATSVQIGVPVPIWDRNQGHIMQAQGNLLRAAEEAHRVRSDLVQRLAEAFEQYENNRVLLDYYRTQILPDQVRAYRGVYERHDKDPDRVSFGDIVNAQQILASTVTTYVSVLGGAWAAVVEVAGLLQTNDLFQVADEHCVAPVPALDQLLELPCCHPCSPVRDPALRQADGSWPAAPGGLQDDPQRSSKPEPR
jgi:cobalt-zinc-cadmium efflux system outer membrane protein